MKNRFTHSIWWALIQAFPCMALAQNQTDAIVTSENQTTTVTISHQAPVAASKSPPPTVYLFNPIYPPAGYYITSITGINDRGQVVGSCSPNNHSGSVGVVWTDGIPQILPALSGINSTYAIAINNSGAVTGHSKVPPSPGGGNLAHAFIWTEAMGMTDLHIGSYQNSSYGYGINDASRVTGVTDAGVGAFLWHPATQGGPTGYNSLPLPPGAISASAFDLNDSGNAVGVSSDGTTSRPFIYANGASRHLGSGGIPYYMNNLDEAVGEGDNRPMYWSANGSPFELPIPDSVYFYAWCLGINDRSEIVGAGSGYSWDNVPIYWKSPTDQPVDLNELVSLPPGWVLTDAGAINNTGSIAGLARSPDDWVGFSLTAVPAGLMVDANRDGVISLPTQSTADLTSSDQPFRFWSNDDNDELKTYTWGESVIPNFFPPGYISPGAIPLPVFYEQEQDDLAVTSATEDWKDDSPDCARDLEDFARLQVYIGGLHEAVRSGQIIIGVKWGSVTRANPSIRLHRHAESTGGTGYLFNTDTVNAQLNLSAIEGIAQVVDETNYLVSGTDIVRLPSRWFSTLSEQNPRLNLLFEGGQVGTGELRLVLLKKEGESYVEIGEGPGVWLDIRKPNEFVERFSCGDDHLGDVVAVHRHSSSATFAAPTKDEEKDYVLYVHGYNMAEFEKQRWIETTYKRLYWLGYKGRVGGFSWPCAQSAPQFDPSEEKAWHSAAQLKSHLANLKAHGYRVHVIAHSQGNVVTGEALRQWAAERHKKADGSPDPLVRTYIASHAAVAASCYKENVPLMPNPGQETPDVYGIYPPTSLPYFDGSAMSGAASRYVNFYNPVDFALTSASGNGFSWETDQRWKPTAPYLYLGGFQKLTLLGFKTLSFPGDRFEIFSYAAEAKSKALGTMPTGGVFTSFTNLQSNQQYGPEHIYHSGQFRASMATRYQYWDGVLTEIGLPSLAP